MSFCKAIGCASGGAHIPRTDPFVISEIGLGTGLNLCLTVAQWLTHRPSGARLHYLGFERAPMRPEDMARALSHWPDLTPIINALLPRWPDPLPGCHRRHFPQVGINPSICGGPMQPMGCKI